MLAIKKPLPDSNLVGAFACDTSKPLYISKILLPKLVCKLYYNQ